MTNSDSQPRPYGVNQSNAIDVLCVSILVAYFLHFALPALGAAFSEDEIMSVYIHWFAGTLKSLWQNACFWEGIGRPGGALYYLPLYHFFGWILSHIGSLKLAFSPRQSRSSITWSGFLHLRA